jgi:hypothetical protein
MPLRNDIQNLLSITVHNGVMLEAEKATITFQQQVQMLRASGMTDDQIRERFLTDFAAENSVLFGAYKNSIKELVAGVMHQSYELGVTSVYDEQYGDQGMMRWTTIGDDSSCDDCADRAGEEAPLREWKVRGMPKSGFSRCGRRCRCELTPVEVGAPARIAG